MKYLKPLLLSLVLFSSTTLASTNNSNTDPLPSWNAGTAKQAIISFVQNISDKNNAQYTLIPDRIATIDNDGTLWVEQPLYTQAIFAINRVKLLAPQHPEWKTQQPFKAIIDNDQATLAKLNAQDFEKILAVTHSGMSVAQFNNVVTTWLAGSVNPHFHRPYTQLVYQPMLELMNYLRANGFKVYIVTGGGQAFVRAFSDKIYGVSVEQVIGTAEKTKYNYQDGHPALTKLPAVLFIDDNEGKPEAINLFIGKKPLIAIGNSDGDRQMLEWTQSRPDAHFMMLIHHDDGIREFTYGPQSKIGTFSDSLMNEAIQNKWTVVSMKNDWKVIFPPLQITDY